MQALNICKTFLGKGVARLVLDDVTVAVNRGERIGLVGENGSGKSTLMKILAREERPDSGRVVYEPDETVAYLPQVLADKRVRDTPATILDYAKGALGFDRLGARLRDLEKQFGVTTGRELTEALDQYSITLDLFESIGGYSFDSRLHEVLAGLGVEVNLDERVSNLSGGQMTRLLFAIALMKNPSVLLLDEPTNHLDTEGVKWVTSFLLGFSGGLIIVSHDTKLLNSLITAVWELDAKTHKVTCFQGNHSSYLTQRKTLEAKAASAYRHQQELIRRLRDSARKLKQYALSGGQSSLAKRAKAIEGRITRMDKVEKPKASRKINFPLSAARHVPDILVEVSAVKKSYSGVTILDRTSMVIGRTDRIAVIGPNGSGKTTLARLIVGEEEPDAGTVKHGRGAKIGYLPQLRNELATNSTILDEFRQAIALSETELRRYLSQFLFSGEDVHKIVGRLSEGEITRLHIAKLALAESNLLILDEPTSALDIESREKLIEELSLWPGALVVISHDQEFLEKIGINRVFFLYNGKMSEE